MCAASRSMRPVSMSHHDNGDALLQTPNRITFVITFVVSGEVSDGYDQFAHR